MKNLLILSFLVISPSLMASTKNIQSIILNDGSTLNRSDLSSVIYSEDQIDYLTLKNGSKVEGLEVKKINYSKKLILAPQVRAAVRVGGDGTGG
jgi:hypothetical protein